MTQITRIDEANSTRLGSAWYHPLTKGIYAGQLGDESVYLGQQGKRADDIRYAAGAIANIDADVQAKIVLSDLLGFARPAYKLDAACRLVPAPELVKTVGVATKGTGQRNVPELTESEITGSVPVPVAIDCHPNEYHIVITDKAARSGAWDMLGNYVQDGAGEIAHMRNQDIKDALDGATDLATGENWSSSSSGVSTYNPLTKIGSTYDTLAALGYPPNFIAMYGSDWGNFLTNTHIQGLVLARMLDLGGGTRLALPGYDDVAILVDYTLSAASAFLGNNRGVILGDGGTEAVKYRNDLKRYTGYLIRQYLDVKIADANSVRNLTGIA